MPIYTDAQTRPDWTYQMLIGTVLTDGRVATLGRNLDVDVATTPEDIWVGASLGVLNGIDHKLIPLPTSAVAMEIVSDSANDAAAGTGARTVLVTYLDTNYISKTVNLTLAGLTPVALPENARRVNNVLVNTAGTNPRGANIGNLSIRAVGGLGATYSYMLAGNGIQQSSIFTVPAGRTLDVLAILNNAAQIDTSARSCIFALNVQNAAGRRIKGLIYALTSTQPYLHQANGAPITSVPAQSDVWVSCEEVSANNTAVSAALFGVLR